MAGAVLTGLFADARVVSFDGLTDIDGGWINVSVSSAPNEQSPTHMIQTAPLGSSGLSDCRHCGRLLLVFCYHSDLMFCRCESFLF